MKQGIITEINWELIGATLANEGDDVQATVLNAMAKEMLSWKTRHQAEMQAVAFAHLMTDDAKELFNIK